MLQARKTGLISGDQAVTAMARISAKQRQQRAFLDMTRTLKLYQAMTLEQDLNERSRVKYDALSYPNFFTTHTISLPFTHEANASVACFRLFHHRVVRVKTNTLVIAQLGKNDLLVMERLWGCLVAIFDIEKAGQKYTIAAHASTTTKFDTLLNILKWQKEHGARILRGEIYYCKALGIPELASSTKQKAQTAQAALAQFGPNFPVRYEPYYVDFSYLVDRSKKSDMTFANILVKAQSTAVISYIDKNFVILGFKCIDGFQEGLEPYKNIKTQRIIVR